MRIVFLIYSCVLFGLPVEPLWAQEGQQGQQDTLISALALPRLVESDVLWSRRVFRIIDLTNARNGPMKELVGLMYRGVEQGLLVPYRSVSCRDTLSVTLFRKAGTYLAVKQELIDPESGYDPENIRNDTFLYESGVDNVRKLLLMEEWYRSRSNGKVRIAILAIAPLIKVHPLDSEEYEKTWAWFRFIGHEVQPGELMFLLKDQFITSGENPVSYVKWFSKRMFVSTPLKGNNAQHLAINEFQNDKDDLTSLLSESELMQMELEHVADDYWEN